MYIWNAFQLNDKKAEENILNGKEALLCTDNGEAPQSKDVDETNRGTCWQNISKRSWVRILIIFCVKHFSKIFGISRKRKKRGQIL